MADKQSPQSKEMRNLLVDGGYSAKQEQPAEINVHINNDFYVTHDKRTKLIKTAAMTLCCTSMVS